MAPKVLADTKAQLTNLVDIIGEVERDPALRTPAIHTQLGLIDSVATELKQILQSMADLQRKSTLRQSLRAFIRRTKDEAALSDVLVRLEKTKAELTLRINVAHVGMTRGIAEHIGVSSVVKEAGPGRSSNTPEQQHLYHLLLERNEAGQESVQMNGIIGFDNPKLAAKVNVTENKALGRSRQTNIVSGQLAITSHEYLWDTRDWTRNGQKGCPSWDGVKT